jgi:hypothetical protein
MTRLFVIIVLSNVLFALGDMEVAVSNALAEVLP